MIKELAYFMCPKCFWADEDDIENRDKTHYCSRCGAVSEYWMSQKVDTVTNRVVKDEEHVETTSNTKLMICPDCGREVSRRAVACIHCGCPLGKQETIVKVRVFAEDVSTDFKMCFFKMGFIELARVPSGVVATFEIDEPTEITV